MDYSTYFLSKKEMMVCIGKGILAGMLAAWILYQSVYGMVTVFIFIPLCIQREKKKRREQQKETLLLQFRDADKMWSYHIIKEQMVHFDRLRSLSTKSKQHDYVLKDHEDILYAIRRHDSEMAEMLMTRHLTRHLSEKKELLTMYPDYFTNN